MPITPNINSYHEGEKFTAGGVSVEVLRDVPWAGFHRNTDFLLDGVLMRDAPAEKKGWWMRETVRRYRRRKTSK